MIVLLLHTWGLKNKHATNKWLKEQFNNGSLFIDTVTDTTEIQENDWRITKGLFKIPNQTNEKNLDDQNVGQTCQLLTPSLNESTRCAWVSAGELPDPAGESGDLVFDFCQDAFVGSMSLPKKTLWKTHDFSFLLANPYTANQQRPLEVTLGLGWNMAW